MAKHGRGIMLIFARVETRVWQKEIFPTADGVMFPDRRISFCLPDGTQGSSAGAPSAFVAWGEECRSALIKLVDTGSIAGAFADRLLCTGSRRE